MQTTACLLCGSFEYIALDQVIDYRLHTTKQIFNLVRCLRCGAVYLNPLPNTQDFQSFYPETFYASVDAYSPVALFLDQLKFRMVNNLKNKGQILDVGCGGGSLLSLFKAGGWMTYGIDTSEKACKLATKRLGGNVYNSTLNDCAFPNDYFDVVFLNHVIEHMTSPYRELEEISRILKNNGLIVICTPNIGSYQFVISRDKWLHLDIPRHVILYSPLTITHLLKKAGFQVANINFPLFDFPLDFYSSLKRKHLPKHNLFCIVFSPWLLCFSIVAKLLPAWRGSMIITAIKKENLSP
ncbi:MAG: class I SAM-dependent methyltransferase [Nitrososphaerota archaeon]|jgi:SAM-dependent methyltransferase|nr:class I SAM-dependent methyltransferase [Nitrososphaerota archaeon]